MIKRSKEPNLLNRPPSLNRLGIGVCVCVCGGGGAQTILRVPTNSSLTSKARVRA